jgi:cbb3-type cytochrome oxidase cytochrome c subunit
MPKGPDLAHVASKEGRNAEWFIAFLKDPKKDNPMSKMPPVGKNMKDEELKAIAEFLASLK